MPTGQDRLVEHFRAMRADLLAAIDGLSDEQLCEKTLDGWSVKDHLAHIALYDELRIAEVRRISAGWETAWHMPGKDHIYSQLGYEVRADLSAAQVLWEIAETHRQLVAGIAEGSDLILDPGRFSEAAMPSTHEAQHTGWIRRWRGERGY